MEKYSALLVKIKRTCNRVATGPGKSLKFLETRTVLEKWKIEEKSWKSPGKVLELFFHHQQIKKISPQGGKHFFAKISL